MVASDAEEGEGLCIEQRVVITEIPLSLLFMFITLAPSTGDKSNYSLDCFIAYKRKSSLI